MQHRPTDLMIQKKLKIGGKQDKYKNSKIKLKVRQKYEKKKKYTCK